MKDAPSMPDFALARRAMVDSQLRPQGVTDRAVLAAMASLPREGYVPVGARASAYGDRAIVVDGGAMLPPTPLALLLNAAAPKPGERALVVGAAPAYSAALLRAIGLLVPQAGAAAPVEPAGPFDLIVVEGAVSDLPAALVQSLAPGGRIVTGLIENGVTRLAVGREAGGAIVLTSFADSDIAPLAAFTRPAAFTF